MQYKINPFELFSNLSLLDFYTFIEYVQAEVEQQNKNVNAKDFQKYLMSLRDILNFMFPM